MAFERHGDALETAQLVAAASAASRKELARDLIAACAARHVSPMWPAGRLVTMRETSTVLAPVRRTADTHETLWGIFRRSLVARASSAVRSTTPREPNTLMGHVVGDCLSRRWRTRR